MTSMSQPVGENGSNPSVRERLVASGLDPGDEEDLIDIVTKGALGFQESPKEFLRTLKTYVEGGHLEAVKELSAAGLDMSSEGCLKELLLDGVCQAGSASAFTEHLKGDPVSGKGEKMDGVSKLLSMVELHGEARILASVELAKAAGIESAETAEREVALWSKMMKVVRDSGGVLSFLRVVEDADPRILGRDLGFLCDARRVYKLKPHALSSILEHVARISQESNQGGADVAEAMKDIDNDLFLQVLEASKAAGGVGNLLGQFNSIRGTEWPHALSILKEMAVERDGATLSEVQKALADWAQVVALARKHGGVRSLLPKVIEIAGVTKFVPMLGILKGAGLLGQRSADEAEIERWRSVCTSIFNCNDATGSTFGVDLLFEAAHGNQLASILRIVPQLRQTEMLAQPPVDSEASSQTADVEATANLKEIMGHVTEAGGAKAFLWMLRGANLVTLRDDLHITTSLKSRLGPSSWLLLGESEKIATLFELVDMAGGLEAFLDRHPGRQRSDTSTSLVVPSPKSKKSQFAAAAFSKAKSSDASGKSAFSRVKSSDAFDMGALSASSSSTDLGEPQQRRRLSSDKGLLENNEVEGPASSKPSMQGELENIFDVDPSALDQLAQLLKGSRDPAHDAELLVSMWQLLKRSRDPAHDAELIATMWHRAQERSDPERVLEMLELIDERFWSVEFNDPPQPSAKPADADDEEVEEESESEEEPEEDSEAEAENVKDSQFVHGTKVTKRPSAWMIFAKEVSTSTVCHGLDLSSRAKKLQEIWNQLSADERAVYENKALMAASATD